MITNTNEVQKSAFNKVLYDTVTPSITTNEKSTIHSQKKRFKAVASAVPFQRVHHLLV